MKALVVVTGRGLGGDAVNAVNIIKSLEKKGFECEIALDSSAPGVLFKKNNYTWHKISVPQAGGHAASRITTIKASFKMINATLKIVKLIKKLKVDVVVGVIGGGAIVGCFGAKLCRVPAVGVVTTPLDVKVCTKLNRCAILPESATFKLDKLPKNAEKSFFLINKNITLGNAENALKKIKEISTETNFDENKKTILFSSGSSLFEMTAKACFNFAEKYDDYNIVLVGVPLEKEYEKYIKHERIINLEYITWLNDLYRFVDLAVLTDDGLMIEEAVICNLPSIAITRVKYGRYHNMESIFKGAVIESEFEDVDEKINYGLNNLEKLKEASKKYSKEIIESQDKIARMVIEEIEKKK